MSDLTKCTSWLGHYYSPRYDTGAPTVKAEFLEGPAYIIIQLVEASKPETYVYDICIRCGHILKR